MPYLIRVVKKEIPAAATSPPPLGPGFSETQAAAADRLEVWGSSMSDSGADYVEFVLFAGKKELARRRVVGY